MIIFNSNVLKFGGFWLGFGSSPTPPQPTIYRINVPPTVQHGKVAVNPTEGPTGTLVTISTVPDTGYELDTISLTGAELINGNQFYIDGSDVTVNVTYKIIEVNPFNTVTIGGLKWSSDNISINDGGSGIRAINVTANGVNFGTQYFYNLEAAQRIANSVDGWHLPTIDEWRSLYSNTSDALGKANAFKSTSGWNNNGNGTNALGFNVIPAGWATMPPAGSPSDSMHFMVGEHGQFWSSTLSSSGAQAISFIPNDTVLWESDEYRNTFMTIRLVKDH